MFGILAKPNSPYKSAKDLAGVPVAVSSNSVIDYVTEELLTSAGVSEDKLESIETKNIGMRMQMLLSGQVEAATLPEPLLTAALGRSAVLLADDAGLTTSQTVLYFSVPFLKAHAQEVKAFLKAVNRANHLIKEEPDAIRPIMGGIRQATAAAQGNVSRAAVSRTARARQGIRHHHRPMAQETGRNQTGTDVRTGSGCSLPPLNS